MALVARCPKCNTAFRIVPDQLKISDGWVRCGKCSHVFNAATTQYETTEKTSPESSIEENDFKITRPPEFDFPEGQLREDMAHLDIEDEGYELTADIQDTQQTYIHSSDTAFADTLFSDNLLSDFHIGWVDTDETDDAVTPIAEKIPKTFEELQHRIAQKKALRNTSSKVKPVTQTAKPASTVIQTLSEEETGENRFTESTIGFGESLFSDSRLPEPLMPVRRTPPKTDVSAKSSAHTRLSASGYNKNTTLPEMPLAEKQKNASSQAKQENPFDFKNAIPVPGLKQTDKISPTGNTTKTSSRNPSSGYLDDLDDFSFASTLQNEVSTLSDTWPEASSILSGSRYSSETSAFETSTTQHTSQYKKSRALERLSSALKDNKNKDDTEVSFIHDDQERPLWKKPAVNISLIVSSFLLTILFFAQAAIAFRDPLATQYPSLRPMINAICQPIGCQAGFLRDPNAIAISTSFDIIDVDGKTVYQLGIMTHNRSAQIIEIPWYELSIFDANGNLVGLKILSPEELYIDRTTLKPREEFFVERYITVNIPGLTAKNYNLSFFYP